MSSQKKPLWIKNATYLTPSMEFHQANLYIKNGIIRDICTQKPDLNPEDEIYDATNLWILPGFINAHTHLPMVLFRGLGEGLSLNRWLNDIIFPLETQLRAEDVRIASMLASAELIHAGCTCFADMYFFVNEIAKTVEETGLRAFLSLGLVQNNGEKGLRDAESFYHQFDQTCNGRLSVHLGPHAIYTCPPEYLKEVIWLSKKLNTPLHIHANETLNEVQNHFSAFQEYPIETMEQIGMFEQAVLIAHCVHLSESEMEVLRRASQVLIVHNPSSNMKLASGIAPLFQLMQYGIPLALGTDGAASNNSLNLFWEMKLASLLSKVSQNDPTVLNPKEIISMVTTSPGFFLGPDHLGCIEKNAPADLIFLDLSQSHSLPHHDMLSNLIYASKGSEVNTMIVDGRIIMKNHVILTFDENQIRHDFKKISSAYHTPWARSIE